MPHPIPSSLLSICAPSLDLLAQRGLATPPPPAVGNECEGVKFSSGGSLDNFLSVIENNPNARTIFQDVIGLGICRTGLDLSREFLYKKTDTGKRHLNFPAARERIVREAGCIFIANFLGGFATYGAGKILNILGYKNMINHFTSNETLEYFNTLAKKSTTHQAFLSQLAHSISPQHQTFISNQLKQDDIEKAAVAIVRRLDPKKTTLDVPVRVNGQTTHFALDTLLKDVSKLSGKTGTAIQSITRHTLNLNKLLIPGITAMTMGFTVFVPLWNIFLTKRIDGFKSYPGLKGLRPLEKVEEKDKLEPWYQKIFPYLTKTVREGKALPLILTLIPLPFALGMVNNYNLGRGLWKAPGYWKGVINLPGKGFWKRVLNMFQFNEKMRPYTTIQQISALTALVSFARIASSRDEIEFRERIIDSFYTTWIMWIIGTPQLHKMAARMWDKKFGTQILKLTPSGQALRNPTEVKYLLPSALSIKTQKVAKSISRIADWSTIGLIGLIEPYLAIKWSEYQVRHEKRA